MPDDWTRAVHEAGQGTRLDVEVVPNAQSPGFPIGYNPWRNRLQARVGAPPEQGKANDELRELVAAFFDVPNASVEVTQGATGRQKQLLVRTLAADAARKRIQEVWR
jgi:uncharacterized protein